MKPLNFDMTPLAKALQMSTPPKTKTTVPARRTHLDRVGTYPRHIAAQNGWLSSLAREQIHALATHLLARQSERGLRTCAVTSALAGEGKTTVTLALAEKLAGADRRVLIVDLDTHRGTLSRETGLEDVPGALESSLGRTNGAAPRLHCYATDLGNVSIMPTGRVEGAEAVPLLDPERLRALVARCLEEYDLVLLDCPPLLPVADTHVIGDVADSAILVVRANSTPKEVLQQALKEFGTEKFFAAVLNRAHPYNIPYFREVYGYYRRTPSR